MEPMVPCVDSATIDQLDYTANTFWAYSWTTVIEESTSLKAQSRT
jgi:hypothetical protein